MIKALSSVVLDLGMNTSLLSVKPLGGEPPQKSFFSWERRRIEAEAGRQALEPQAMSSHLLQVRSSLAEMACLLRQGIAC